MISAIQCRMARAALDWTVADLSAAAGVGATTIVRFERGQTAPNRSTITSLQHALEAAGLQVFKRRRAWGESRCCTSPFRFNLAMITVSAARTRASNFKIAVNKSFLDEYDLHQNANQPRGKYLLKRLPRTVGPWVIVAWGKGRRPIAGVIRLGADDFSASPTTAPGKAAARRGFADPRHTLGRQRLSPPRGYVRRRWPLTRSLSTQMYSCMSLGRRLHGMPPFGLR